MPGRQEEDPGACEQRKKAEDGRAEESARDRAGKGQLGACREIFGQVTTDLSLSYLFLEGNTVEWKATASARRRSGAGWGWPTSAPVLGSRGRFPRAGSELGVGSWVEQKEEEDQRMA